MRWKKIEIIDYKDWLRVLNQNEFKSSLKVPQTRTVNVDYSDQDVCPCTPGTGLNRSYLTPFMTPGNQSASDQDLKLC